MAVGNPPWTLTIPSDLQLLALVRTFIETVCQVGGLEPAVIDGIVVATHEAASNAIRHAHRGNPQAQLQIVASFDSNVLEIQVLDEGQPFDLASVPRLDPSEVRVGGRGLFLMRALMDELSCQPRGLQGNALRMVKRCGTGSPRSQSA
jgi:serine/threonine-protein kinase RsbW